MPEPFELDLKVANTCYWFIEVELSVYGVEPPRDTLLRLELGAGKDASGEVVYQPYKLIGDILNRTINQKHLNAGEGATLRDADKSIIWWYQEQRNLNAAMGVTAPPEAATGVRSKGSFSVRTTTVYD